LPLKNGGDDLELTAAAVRAVLRVDVKVVLEQPHPPDALWSALNHPVLAFTAEGGVGRLRCYFGPVRHPPRHQRRTDTPCPAPDSAGEC
jgi:hypothetical protein